MSASELSIKDSAKLAPRQVHPVAGFLNRYATPLIIGLFLISAISGVALFFHWASGTFHEMHEWLSMVLLAPFVLHLWKNWRAFLGYFGRGTIVLPLALCLVLVLPFAYSGMTARGRGNPGFRVTTLLTGARIADLAPVLRTTPDALLKDLRTRGYRVQTAAETLDAVAAASGEEPAEVLFSVVPAR